MTSPQAITPARKGVVSSLPFRLGRANPLERWRVQWRRGRTSPAGAPVVLALAAVVGVTVGGAAAGTLPADRPTAALTLTVDAGANRLVLTHRAGDPLTPERLVVRVRIDGRPLAEQPPIPSSRPGASGRGPRAVQQPKRRCLDPGRAGGTPSGGHEPPGTPPRGPGDGRRPRRRRASDARDGARGVSHDRIGPDPVTDGRSGRRRNTCRCPCRLDPPRTAGSFVPERDRPAPRRAAIPPRATITSPKCGETSRFQWMGQRRGTDPNQTIYCVGKSSISAYCPFNYPFTQLK